MRNTIKQQPSHYHSIFTGVVGGPNYDITGGGVDFQCLPPNPELNNYNPSATDVSWIRSVEYESQNYGLFADDIDNKHAVCSRCFTGQFFIHSLCCGFVSKSLSLSSQSFWALRYHCRFLQPSRLEWIVLQLAVRGSNP